MDEGLSITGRRVCGWALKWGEPAFISEDGRHYRETFRRGAFLTSIEGGQVRLCLDHHWDSIVASQADGSLVLVEDRVGLRVDAIAQHTVAGDDAISAVRCRDRAGLSVMFQRPDLVWSEVDGVRGREVVRCRLLEVSVVRNPAYRSSEIVAGAMRINAFLERVAELDHPSHATRLARLEAAEAALARS